MTFLERFMPSDASDLIIWRSFSGTTLLNTGSGGSAYDATAYDTGGSTVVNVDSIAGPFYSVIRPNSAQFYKTAGIAMASLSSGLTISGWMYASGLAVLDRLLVKQNRTTWTGSPIYPILLMVSSGSTSQVSAVANAATTVSGSIVAASWNHVGVVVNSAQTLMSLYINGALAGSSALSALSLDTDNGPWCMAGRTPTPVEYMGGLMYDWRVAQTERPLSWFSSSYVRGMRFFGSWVP